MAKHVKTVSNEVIKTYSFKVKSTNGIESTKLLDAISEQQKYYNLCSDFIKSILNIKIGDLINFLPEEKRTSKVAYIEAITSGEWKDKPLYMMFKKGYSGQNRDNVLYEVIKNVNPEQYNGNILGFSETHYRRFGYVSSVISNYATKISKMSTGAKRHAVNSDSNNETICEQIIYEMEHHGWTSAKDWEEWVDYLNSSPNYNEDYKDRVNMLRNYYLSNTEEINNKMETMAINSLINFGGCRMKGAKKSMRVMGSSNTPFVINRLSGNSLNIKFSNILDIDVYGRRDVIKDGNLLFDITNGHGDSFILKVVNDEIYIDINCKVPFEKEIFSTKKVVGIDVNIKHALLATNIDGSVNLDGYVNIYKEAIEDEEFRKVCSSKILKDFESHSTFVSFCPLEFDLLFSRVCKQRGVFNEYSEAENAFSNVLYCLKKRFIESGDNVNRIYVENILKLRAQIKAYAVVKNAYYDKQSVYDADKTEEFIQENPFSNTVCGKELLGKVNRIAKKIIGCRNNIIQYAYSTFEKNGYDMISLEKLTSSQFEKVRSLPSISSLLKYHKVMGCTDAEVSEKEIYSVVKKGYYDFTYDGDKISGAELSEHGQLAKIKDDFFNLMIKSIHFAEIKDYFVTLSNNGGVGVSLVPSSFTSQMDSLEHKIYCEKDNKTGKLKLLNKKKIRRTQESHINGLNADYNAARNIAYLMSNDKLRGMFMKPADITKSLYNKPCYETFVKNQASVVSKLKKEGMVSIIEA